MTKKEAIAELKELGVEFDENASATDIKALLEEAKGEIDTNEVEAEVIEETSEVIETLTQAAIRINLQKDYAGVRQEGNSFVIEGTKEKFSSSEEAAARNYELKNK